MFCGRNRDTNITQVNFSWERSLDTLETETRESTAVPFKLAIGFIPRRNVFLCNSPMERLLPLLHSAPSSPFISRRIREIRK